MLILGIDPGTARLGFGLVQTDDLKIKYIEAGCLETKMETPMHERLLYLYEEMNKIFVKHKPDVLAVESLFFGINAKTAIAVGQARGVILLLTDWPLLLPITLSQTLVLLRRVRLSVYEQAQKVYYCHNCFNVGNCSHKVPIFTVAIPSGPLRFNGGSSFFLEPP